MSDKRPIDYARADADVVRKKFRRRVVMFVIATVVVMGIGLGSLKKHWTILHWKVGQPMWGIGTNQGWLNLTGPPRKTTLNANWPVQINLPIDEETNWYEYHNRAMGIVFRRYDYFNSPKWTIAIRYRTLFLLTTIPWLITLIRMIRMWKRRRVLSPEP